MKLIRAMVTVGGLTLVSRVAGFLRDVLTARYLGAGPVADAFFVALKFPNFFRRITAEGAFTVSFVPLYARYMTEESLESANTFARNAMGIMIAILLPFTLLCLIAMPALMFAVAPGFGEGTVRYDMAVLFSRITFPYLLLMSVTALIGGVLNAHDKFAPFAAAPIFFNMTMVVCLLGTELFFPTAGHALAWGVTLAGLIQLVFVWFCAKRIGIILVPTRPVLTPQLRRLFKLMIPATIGAGAVQVNLFADMMIASFLPEGAISHLYYADRLHQLPLGVVGIAIGTALLPMLARAIAANNASETERLFNRALEVCLFLALPAALALGVSAQPIVFALFRQGAFTMADAQVTATALSAYALGLPAYIAAKIYATACFAREDTRTPVIVSFICVTANICFSLLFVFGWGMNVTGVALATGLAGWVQFILLWWHLNRKQHIAYDDRLRRTLPKLMAAAIAMAGVLFGVGIALDEWFLASGLPRVLALGALVGSGGVVYAGIIFATRALTLTDIKGYFSKQTQ